MGECLEVGVGQFDACAGHLFFERRNLAGAGAQLAAVLLLHKPLAAADARARGDSTGTARSRPGLTRTWPPARPESRSCCRSIANSQAALVLVTPALIKSGYVLRVELPALLARFREPASGFLLFWVLLEPCGWKAVMLELAEVQSIADPNRPLSHGQSSADEQVQPIQVVASVARALGELTR